MVNALQFPPGLADDLIAFLRRFQTGLQGGRLLIALLLPPVLPPPFPYCRQVVFHGALGNLEHLGNLRHRQFAADMQFPGLPLAAADSSPLFAT